MIRSSCRSGTPSKRNLIVCRDAIRGSVRRCERQEHALLLNSRESLLLEEHCASDSGLGLDHPRQEGLGAKKVRNESEVFLEVGKGGERRAQIHFTEVPHGGY